MNKLVLILDDKALKRLNGFNNVGALCGGGHTKADILLDMICEALNKGQKELIIKPTGKD